MLLLKDYRNSKIENNNFYKIDKSIFGKGKSHHNKFMIALQILPEVCGAYQRVDVYENEKLFLSTYNKDFINLRKVHNQITSELSKYGHGTLKGSITIATDFEMRKNLLYLDWNEKIEN